MTALNAGLSILWRFGFFHCGRFLLPHPLSKNETNSNRSLTGQFVGVKNLSGSNLSVRPLILHVISNVQLPPATQQENGKYLVNHRTILLNSTRQICGHIFPSRFNLNWFQQVSSFAKVFPVFQIHAHLPPRCFCTRQLVGCVLVRSGDSHQRVRYLQV